MYLKSIEVHGFKSFANKIVFQFHNGITAIVGPNGSGKSNVADAVRWVLGEQSAKSLRGASMQDVIFAGTELRRPLGYASVSITLDNSDHQLPVAYDEVTVTRRVYRSGESEYRLNGTQVRLKDINELFYDTGIGKEGYSIIGQGQIEKILSGRPEERRELFDEAAGIVKFKRRKQAALKKLEDERQNLVRVTDILSELTRQLDPLKKQAETARIYLGKKELLKEYEINLFLLDQTRLESELAALEEKKQTVQGQLFSTREKFDRAKQEYETAQREIERMDALLQEKREEASAGLLRRQQAENQIRLLQEQIHTAQTGDEHRKARIDAITERLSAGEGEEQNARKDLEASDGQLRRLAQENAALQEQQQEKEREIRAMEQEIAHARAEIVSLLNQRATVKARLQRYDTMLEQSQIRSAQLAQELLQLKSEETEQESIRREIREAYEDVTERIRTLTGQSDRADESLAALQEELTGYNHQMDEEQRSYHREASRLESLKNIAERYDGYGSSIRRVMERKDRDPGILGVVADLIKVEKAYETAIETALGGSIQNIVTDTEETAKRQIEFLKRNRYGRATFLPLSGVSGRGGFSTPQALKENGVIGLASTLVRTEKKYAGLAESLLGRTVVVHDIDSAIALARKYRHSLRIVTKEGELLSPGGSMTGGAFKNTGNLLGRRREIEELELQVRRRREELDGLQTSIDRCRSSRNRLREELVRLKEELQQEYLKQNTARLRLEELGERTGSTSQNYRRLQTESSELGRQMQEIRESQEAERMELSRSEQTEQELESSLEADQEKLEALRALGQKLAEQLQELQLTSSRLEQQAQFGRQNLLRLQKEKAELIRERRQYEEECRAAAGSVQEKEQEISGIEAQLRSEAGREQKLQDEIRTLGETREKASEANRGFFEAREELSEQISLLDRESFRLHAQQERMEEQRDGQISEIWEEYGLTARQAQELKKAEYDSIAPLKKSILALKTEIKALGSVNVNAMEDYRELSERHTFLSAQHEDLKKAEEALLKIIGELDTGMRTQFQEQFAQIQREFDKAFGQLFGGGRGTLELVEEEDILTAGIRIIAQPPGKKLQNMMQLSGGEKALTAIALLFAIQNLKPSPFCLLDEIEAALDESNVDRYAGYLHRLTKNTQFIIITHRRGTMAAADRLYGITMQEKGVSALVSVNLIEEDLEN